MSRVPLLSLAALGVILAGCSSSTTSPETNASTSPATNASASNSATNATPSGDAANESNANVAAPGSNSNEPATNAGATNTGTTAQADDAGQPAGSLNLKKREPMLAFKMTSTKGQTLTNENLKGKVVVLDFWATWCGPCKQASPTMEKLHKTYAAQGLEVIGANVSENSDKEGAAAKYQKEHGYTYTFTKNNDELGNRLGINGIPCFIFIDKKGNVREVAEGFDIGATPAEFEKVVKDLLAEA